MTTDQYDRHRDRLVALAARIAPDVEHVSALPDDAIANVKPNRDPREPITWRPWTGWAASEQDRNDLIETAKWLRDTLPTLADGLAGTDGVDIDSNAEERRTEFLPEGVESALTCDYYTDGQATFWAPADLELSSASTYDDGTYEGHAGHWFVRAWTEYVCRTDDTWGGKRVENALDRAEEHLARL